MFKLIVVLYLLLPVTGFSQFTITGKIINKVDNNPVSDASVFFNNATIGSKTKDDGTFTLSSIPSGQYDLVVSAVGFETLHQTIMVNVNLHLPDVFLTPKTIELKEVKIKGNNNRQKDFETFKSLFLGTTDFSTDCKILNPDILDFDYDSSTQVFSAKSYDYLEIDNKALGYKVRYFLNDLKNDAKTGICSFEGTVSFEELIGSPSQQNRWKKNRLKVYLGSSMHFLRANISNNLQLEGFRVLRMIRNPNPNNSGSAYYRYNETLVPIPYLTQQDFFRHTTVEGQYGLVFKDCLYVMYSRKWAKMAAKDTALASFTNSVYLDEPKITTVVFQTASALFDSNGIFLNPQSVLFEGSWGKNLVADLLPVDYLPK